MPVDLDDEYVADLLKQDAKNATKKYELVGIDAFNLKKRLRPGAPRPNTNFLRHIIRQTDNHNAALLAKEAEESNARLRSMNRESSAGRYDDRRARRTDGRLTPVPTDDHGRGTSSRSRRHVDDEDEDEQHRRKHRRRDGESTREQSVRHRHKNSESQRSGRHSKDTRAGGHGRTRVDRDKRRRAERYQSYSDEEDSGRRERSHHRHRRRHRSRSPPSSSPRSRSRSASPRARKQGSERRYRERERERERDQDRRHRSSSRNLGKRDRAAKASHSEKRREERHPNSNCSDSDPLEAIVGPLPPSKSDVRSRGRGAHKANGTGIESRFSSAYDPTMDIKPDSDAEDEWGSNVEAFRDRQRWKQQGAERLRAAGFTESQINKWEKGDERNEDDVVWASKGQARDWDRGKVIGEDGDTALEADFGRLK